MGEVKLIAKLPEDTAKKFRLAKGTPVIFENLTVGTVDVRILTIEKAQQLIDAGCIYITAKAK